MIGYGIEALRPPSTDLQGAQKVPPSQKRPPCVILVGVDRLNGASEVVGRERPGREISITVYT